MSWEATGWAWKVQGLSASERLVLLSLANFANRDHQCWPSVSTLIEDTGLSERTIKTVTASLHASGHLVKTEQVRDDGSRSSNIYRLSVGKVQNSHPPVQPLHPPRATIAPLNKEDSEPVIRTSIKGQSAKTVEPPPEPAISQAVKVWNDMAKLHSLPTCTGHAGKRGQHIAARLKDVGLDGWTHVVSRIPDMPFCLGVNDRKWKVDIDYLARPSGWQNLIEGKFLPDRQPIDLTSPSAVVVQVSSEDHADQELRRLRICLADVEQHGGRWLDEWEQRFGCDLAGARQIVARADARAQAVPVTGEPDLFGGV
jgi:hypothetical protein